MKLSELIDILKFHQATIGGPGPAIAGGDDPDPEVKVMFSDDESGAYRIADVVLTIRPRQAIPAGCDLAVIRPVPLVTIEAKECDAR